MDTENTIDNTQHDDTTNPLDEVKAEMTLLRFIAKSQGGDSVKTLAKEDFTVSECFTVKELTQLTKVHKVDILSNADYLRSQIGTSMKVTFGNGAAIPVFIEQIIGLSKINRTIRMAAQITIAAHLAHDLETERINGRGGFPIKLSELEITQADLLKSFNLTDASTVEVIEIDPSDYDMHQFYGEDIVENSHYRHIMKVKNFGFEDGDSHLAVNVHSIKDIRFRPMSYRCSKKNGGCGAGNLGLLKVSKANGCPKCGNSRSALTKQQICFDLPQIVDGKLSASADGQVKFTRVKIDDQKLCNYMMMVKKGIYSPREGIDKLINSTKLKAYTRRYSDKSDKFYPVTLRPAAFDLNGTVYLGLAVEMSELLA